MSGEARGVGGIRPGVAGGIGRQAKPRGGFTLGGAGEGAEAVAAELSATAGIGALAGLLSLQERESGASRDEEAERRAEAMLDELAGLQLELLGAGMDPARLRRLAGLHTGESGANAALREVVEGIALRARLELARRGLE